MGFFEGLSARLQSLFQSLSGKAVITEQNVQSAMEEVKEALLEADVNVRVVRRFVNRVLESARGMEVVRSVTPAQQFVKILYDNLVALLGDANPGLTLRGPDVVSVILLVGLQGHGKTTSAAKLAHYLKNKGRRVLLAAADRARPAAVQQLVLLGQSVGIPVYQEGGEDPIVVAEEALKRARREQFDTLIVDTAGRLEADQELMRQLVTMKQRLDPVEVILVADAMTGQTAVSIAQAFDQDLGLTGFLLTKFDSDSRGGAALSLKSITGKPIKFVGVGERIEALEPFHPDRVASRILGMGDVVSLVEKAQQVIDRQEAERLRQKMASATFTLQDYLDQIRHLRKMGSVESLMQLIPGAAGIADPTREEAQLKADEAIILSMTPYERQNPLILNPSRRQRIARGSGTSVFQINQLIKRFEKMRETMKKLARNKSLQEQLGARLAQGPIASPAPKIKQGGLT